MDVYRYLGIFLDQKLSPRRHIEYLFGARSDIEKGRTNGKGKTVFLSRSLGPCLRDISFDYKLNLWVIFVKPLFLPLATLSPILTNTDRELVETKLRLSLKRFLQLPKNFRSDILEKIFPIDFLRWMDTEWNNNRERWKCREEGAIVDKENLEKYRVLCQKWLPREFGQLLRKFTVYCKVCKKTFLS